ncbi:MAG: hypothetical protein LBT59_04435, partial [Clostridiales bacterium]|nr:hypothetical protein [Clostridiales bacterium]
AKLLENRCKANDGESVAAGFELLMLQWKRARNGLQVFSERMKNFAPAEEDGPKPDLSEVFDLLRDNMRKPALSAIKALMAQEPETVGQATLGRAKAEVERLNFGEAESILRTWEKGQKR